MKLSVVIAATLCVAVSFVLPHSSASSDQVNVEGIPSAYGGSDSAIQVQFPLPLLPRKLKLQEQIAAMKSFSDKDIMQHRKMMEAPSGNKQHDEENVMQKKGPARKGTRVQEGSNTSEYFTMDYNWVRRRRPIHNKQNPLVP